MFNKEKEKNTKKESISGITYTDVFDSEGKNYTIKTVKDANGNIISVTKETKIFGIF